MKSYLPLRNGRPSCNPIGFHVVMPYQNRELIGEVTAIEYREFPSPGYTLTVKHFNGEPWPLNPSYCAVKAM